MEIFKNKIKFNTFKKFNKFNKFNKLTGQITSTEFLIVSSVLIILFIFAANFWNIVAIRFSNKSLRSSLELTALDISDFLIKNPGMPTSWESNTTIIYSLGLASSPNTLTQSKVSAFTTLNYNSSKKILGIPNYEYKFRIRMLNGIVLLQSGLDPTATAEVVSVTRFVLLNSSITKMEFAIWR